MSPATALPASSTVRTSWPYSFCGIPHGRSGSSTPICTRDRIASTLSCSFGERTRSIPATWLSAQSWSSQAGTLLAVFFTWSASPVATTPAASVAPIAVPVTVMVSSAGPSREGSRPAATVCTKRVKCERIIGASPQKLCDGRCRLLAGFDRAIELRDDGRALHVRRIALGPPRRETHGLHSVEMRLHALGIGALTRGDARRVALRSEGRRLLDVLAGARLRHALLEPLVADRLLHAGRVVVARGARVGFPIAAGLAHPVGVVAAGAAGIGDEFLRNRSRVANPNRHPD